MRAGLVSLALFSFAMSCAPDRPHREVVAQRSDAVLAWGEQSKLSASDPTGSARFGAAIALSGTTVIIGAPGIGAAYVLIRSGATWTQQAKLVPTDGPGFGFGTSVAISGESVVVGSPQRDTSGAAYVFVRSGTTWTQQAKLASTGTKGMYDSYGQSVSIDGDGVLVGAPGSAGYRGTVYYFTRAGTTWTERQQLTPYSPLGNDQFGAAVAITPTLVAVGAPVGTANKGRVHLFAPIGFSGTPWIESSPPASPKTGDGTMNEFFGQAISADGDTIAVGMPGVGGGVFVFTKTGSTGFKQDQKLLGLDTVVNDRFGRSVSVKGNTIAIGNKNTVYIFLRTGLTWAQQAKLTISDPQLGDELGFATAIEGDTAVTGAPAKTTDQRGAAYVHRFLLSKGDACTTSAQCLSNHCVDGACCDRACDGQCEACDVSSFVGTCRTVTGAPHGARTACTGDGSECGQRTCNGVDPLACQLPGVTKPCGTTSCMSGVETHVGKCTGAGACDDVPKACGAYACTSTACGTSCVASGDCAAGHYCKAMVCVPLEGLGAVCSLAAPCSAGLSCTDGFCCGVAACAAGSTCGYPGKLGTCTKIDGTACANAAECGSGNCVDGVCCNTACAGQCEACDVASALGKCTPVSGAPHGSRTECDKGGTGVDQCKAMTCDGAKDATKCVGFAKGSETQCKPGSCSGSSFIPGSTCDLGTCKEPSATSCVPYNCNSAGCLLECAADSDCATSYRCQDKKCVEGAQCSGDKLSSIGKDGTPKSCAPFRCGPDGNCLGECNTSDDCAPGLSCNTGSKTCEPAAAATDEGSGCGCRTTPSSPAGIGLVMAGVLLALSRRGGARRRSS